MSCGGQMDSKIEWITGEGKRNRGRQTVRWGNEIKKFPGIKWNQLTQDWTNWKLLGEAFVLQWT